MHKIRAVKPVENSLVSIPHHRGDDAASVLKTKQNVLTTLSIYSELLVGYSKGLFHLYRIT
jgi:hypothetical protein